MSEWLDKIVDMATDVAGKIILALVVYLVGRFVIKTLLKWLGKSKLFDKAEASVKTFALSFVKIGLNVLLVISIIGILGVPMASVIAVLASAGAAIGLALQGALSNLAGGIMLMVFKPFRVGDYIEAAGEAGTATEITLFYSVITTVDNKRVTVPNGTLMNANIINYSTEPLRRVDLVFTCGKGESPEKLQELMLGAMRDHEKVLADPEPFARLSGGTNEAMQFTARAWCKNDDYWDVYFDLTQRITELFGENGVTAPAVKIISEK